MLGNYAGWKAQAIGANSQGAQSILKTDYKDDDMKLDVLFLFFFLYRVRAHVKLSCL